MSINIQSVTHHLSTPTQLFGLKLWITILICIGLLTAILMIISLCSSCNRKKLDKSYGLGSSRVMDRKLLSRRCWEEQVVCSGHSNWSGIHVVDMQLAVTGGDGRCKNYSARELHVATDGFSEGYIMSRGEHADVYRGILLDGKRVAIKKFINKRLIWIYIFPSIFGALLLFTSCHSLSTLIYYIYMFGSTYVHPLFH